MASGNIIQTSMRDILFDFTYYQGNATFHGGGEYGNVVLEELLHQSEQVNCGIFFYWDRKLNTSIVKRCQEAGWNLHAICDSRNIGAIVREYKYTTIYSTLPYAINWRKIYFPENVRFVGTFHGLRRVELSNSEKEEMDFYERKREENRLCYIFGAEDHERQKRDECSYVDALTVFKKGTIVTVSEHTKHSILYHFPELQHSNIVVLYSPPKLIEETCSDLDREVLKENQLTGRNFGLIVSAGIWYKNARRAVLAYDRVFDRQYKFIPSDYKVVVLGVNNKEDFLNGLVHRDRFLVLSYVSTQVLEVLYRNAQLFVYPSLNEGFGYPPLEAMKYGTLCACSSNTSITEICKDMVLYFNPLLIDEIAIRIIESFSDNVRTSKEEKMKQLLPVVWKRQKEDLQKLIKIIIGEA